ncbi:hypothetical protein [Sphaerisporangium siamense]|uniref:GAF domain-containing protein n=1 Tax=Sphaerisporangium siamense TaxID=795645 RepID=A0A7W7D4H9_9ACTN|nr:hypothetical protein [Sphaerisporangium siamense]MBB4700047.1 hypothetical protein [Sphaerisporangium siamense]
MDGDASAELSVGEQVLAEVLRVARAQPPARLADVITDNAGPLGVRRVVVYLADLQEKVLVPLPPEVPSGAGGDDAAQFDAEPDDPDVAGRERGVVRIEGTVAGLAYRKLTVVTAEDSQVPGELTRVGEPARRHRIWLPLVDGNVRVGVLELTVDHLDEQVLQRCQLLAGVVALLVVSHGGYSDVFNQLRRRERMRLSAEMVWAFIPGQTFATQDVVICAAAEPVYQLGGDAYDFSIMNRVVHVSLFDAAGHDRRRTVRTGPAGRHHHRDHRGRHVRPRGAAPPRPRPVQRRSGRVPGRRRHRPPHRMAPHHPRRLHPNHHTNLYPRHYMSTTREY